MKLIDLTYHDDFPASPISGWTGPRYGIWVRTKTSTGQRRKPGWQRAPFYSSRRKWARLEVHLDGINMVFATPLELDHFVDVMSRNPLPKGANLYPGFERPGLPNQHWLSRFPAKGKTAKFRAKAVRFLISDHPRIRAFRTFYEGTDYDETAGSALQGRVTGQGTYQAPYEVQR